MIKNNGAKPQAFLDTGASLTQISPWLFDHLAITEVDSRPLIATGGIVKISTGVGFVRFSDAPEEIFQLDIGKADHDLGFDGADAVIGIDLLRNGTLSLSGPSRRSKFSLGTIW